MVEIPGTAASSTVVARPARRPLVVVVPLAAAAVALCGWASGQRLIATSGIICATAILGWRYILIVVRARSVAGPNGIGNRLFRRERHLSWDVVAGLEIRRSLFGRVVRVVLQDGRSVELAAPREAFGTDRAGFDETVAAMRAAAPGDLPLTTAATTPRARGARTYGGWPSVLFLLVLAVGLASVFDQPWDSPFWPSRHEVSRLPDACAVLRRAPATALVQNGLPDGSDAFSGGSELSRCRADGAEDGRTFHLSLRYDLLNRYAGSGGSGSAVAHRLFEDSVSPLFHKVWTPLRGLGDEARRSVRDSGDGHSGVTVVVRRANVVVTVDYTTQTTAAQTTSGAERMARAAVDGLRLA